MEVGGLPQGPSMHKGKPLYKVYEEKYKQEVELPQLE